MKSRAIAEITWDWSEPRRGYGILLPGIFEKWHRGKNLGLELVGVGLDGHTIGPHALERLNYWLEADGAWRASLLSHFEAEKVLAAVMRRNIVLKLGGAGGGRWPTGTAAEKLLRDGGESVQRVFGF